MTERDQDLPFNSAATGPRIGVFDSGVGGLTVLRELVRNIPHASYLYFGDTARLPYGSKSAETVARYAIEAAHFLEARGMDMLVVACNTATALALPAIRQAVTVPVEGVIEPGAEAAAAATRRNRVVVIATEATIGSHAYKHALEQHNINVCEKACPLFVPLIEEGWLDHGVTQRVAHIYLDDFFYEYETGPDVLVLGCTHYPLIKPILRSVCPWRVEIVDSAECTAKAVARKLSAPSAPRGANTEISYFVTDSIERFRRLSQLFMGQKVENAQLVSIGG
ncbi:MAG: glutamate racemase [Terriglobales bacterium]